MTFRVGIIGCGLVGRKRLAGLPPQCELVALADRSTSRLAEFSSVDTAIDTSTDWRAVATHPRVQLVVVATTPDTIPEVALCAIEAGKHVLVEKPAARRAQELDPLIEAAERNRVRVHVGFNHRFHPAIRKCHALVAENAIGPPLFIRAHYGHGGRLGYEHEWRFDASVSGGGELIDQGTHLIDLACWFIPSLEVAAGFTPRYFWPGTVEDNAFVLLRARDNRAAWLHASWTEWRNSFLFEVVGREGKLVVEGLGGSYGIETLTHYRMGPRMGPPEVKQKEYPGPDSSWSAEIADFVDAIEGGNELAPSLEDARRTMELVEQVYACSGQ